jgi:hypothetical protein
MDKSFSPFHHVSQILRIGGALHAVAMIGVLGVALVAPPFASGALAQEDYQQQQIEQQNQSCIITGGCDKPLAPAPELVPDLWNAIAFSPSNNIAAFAGSFTLPENAKAAALKGCAARAADCRIISAAHDICLAVAYERKAGGAYRAAMGASKQDAEGEALPVCLAEGPQRCTVLAGCSGQPPQLILSK